MRRESSAQPFHDYPFRFAPLAPPRYGWRTWSVTPSWAWRGRRPEVLEDEPSEVRPFEDTQADIEAEATVGAPPVEVTTRLACQ